MALLLLAVWGLEPRRNNARRQVAQMPAPLAAGDPIFRPTPPLGLIDDRGKQISLTAFRGKWLILAPSMTLCSEVCPMTTGVLMQV
jgi:cytochrome oxidase Cu insertion factor (SCO1/SenC/PrrC family)